MILKEHISMVYQRFFNPNDQRKSTKVQCLVK